MRRSGARLLRQGAGRRLGFRDGAAGGALGDPGCGDGPVHRSRRHGPAGQSHAVAVGRVPDAIRAREIDPLAGAGGGLIMARFPLGRLTELVTILSTVPPDVGVTSLT